MKLIHCADLHLGSKIQSKLSVEKAEIRRKEVRDAFENMLKHAEQRGVSCVLICGDAFDGDRPSLRDKHTFYDAAANYPDMTFFYLRGNHDCQESGAYTETLPNLKTFGTSWRSYTLTDRGAKGNFGAIAREEIVITGAEWRDENAETLYSTLCLPENSLNIVMLHGDIHGKIDLRRLQGKNIDYLALGHLHMCARGELDERGVYAYSGCLEGRGYDECGKKGYLLLDTNKPSEQGKGVFAEFVPSSIRELSEWYVDVSAAKDDFEARRIVESKVLANAKDLVRVYLCGETDFDRQALLKTVREALERKYFFADVKDQTRAKCDFEKIAKENSLKGEFVRLALSDEDLSAEEKDAVIRLGLSALERGTAEL